MMMILDGWMDGWMMYKEKTFDCSKAFMGEFLKSRSCLSLLI